mmetsp:Transcript_29328/g.86889  ORF Transcript_29328/g.86889 Transcript_29328/m.86889 type:complete len:230 (+) Transcript_29328:587-1276(+)
MLHRRIRQDGPERSGRHSRGDGAADHIGDQGGNTGHPQRPSFRTGGGQSHPRTIRPHKDSQDQRRTVRPHPQPFRPILRRTGRVRRIGRLQRRQAHPRRPSVHRGRRPPSLRCRSDETVHTLRPDAPPPDRSRIAARIGRLLPATEAGGRHGTEPDSVPHHGPTAGEHDPTERGPGEIALRRRREAVVREGGLPAAQEVHHTCGDGGRYLRRGRGGRRRPGRRGGRGRR